jgi:hypothetical protein
VRIKDGSKLHGYWGRTAWDDNTDRFIEQLAGTIEQQNPRPATLDMQPDHWINEGFETRQQVYSFTGAGATQNPAVLSDEYSTAGGSWHSSEQR